MGQLLILETEPMVARILEHKLRREGHVVTWRREATAAPEEVDVALVDVALGGDGDSWMGEGPAPRAGWFAICEHEDEETARRAVRAGAAGVIRKPFKPTEVAAQVAALLRLRGR
jgi:DNA-binding response OmpR family regulator